MQNSSNRGLAADLGRLTLRSVLAILILFHGIHKVQHGIGPIIGMVSDAGLPSEIAYLVYCGEVIAPTLVLIGLWTRLAAIVIAINMTMAVLLAHTTQFFTLDKTGGWALELQAMYFFSALALTLLGAGRFSVGGSSGKLN